MTKQPQLTFDSSQRRTRLAIQLSSYLTIQLSNYSTIAPSHGEKWYN